MSETKDVLILAIESSCDETAAAVVKNGREVLSNVISSQIALHTLYGPGKMALSICLANSSLHRIMPPLGPLYAGERMKTQHASDLSGWCV